ncbi:TPA: hypothetical protein TUT07_001894 [Streptococcus equi subsp. zooepidemicus]|uniref:hypothetical protein n=1 Tax=Streptococcus equi TaxID=1336 RepID=UPI000DA2CEBB|nr:hypothetical protein [Streptococcus equi]SQF53435.1 M-like protein [Streptococcus equi subsp. zooepidemicus]HEL0573101.1 hypothetical protein [Streptococcus equi subsp. zooepidemicus]
MNKKSAKRKRSDIIAKLAMTSALTLGVGAAAVMTEQTEVRADVLYQGSLDMRNKEAVEKFVQELKEEVKKNILMVLLDTKFLMYLMGIKTSELK